MQDFSLLKAIDQEKAVLHNGTFLANYDNGNTAYDVYKLFNFYVSSSFEINGHQKVTIGLHKSWSEIAQSLQTLLK